MLVDRHDVVVVGAKAVTAERNASVRVRIDGGSGVVVVFGFSSKSNSCFEFCLHPGKPHDERTVCYVPYSTVQYTLLTVTT